MPGASPLLSGLEFRRVLCAHGRQRLCPPRVTPALRHCCPVQAIGGSVPTVGGQDRAVSAPSGTPSLSSCPEHVHCCPVQALGGSAPRGETGWGGVDVLRHALFVVMPGLVPGIHVPLPVRPLPAHTAMPQDVDTRNKSGHDGRRDAGVPKPVSRAERSFGNLLVPMPFARSAKSKPDSSGTRPGMTVGGMPARRNPCLASSDPLEPRSYPRLSPGQAHPNRTAVERVRR